MPVDVSISPRKINRKRFAPWAYQLFEIAYVRSIENRLEPIFDPYFSESSFGYRPGRSAHHAMRKIYCELLEGFEWVVNADLRNYFGTVNHEKLIDMIAEKVSDSRILELIRQMLKGGAYGEIDFSPRCPSGWSHLSTSKQHLSNAFDHEMERKEYRLTRWADDWLVLCKTKEETDKALEDAKNILQKLGLTLHPEKTRISILGF